MTPPCNCRVCNVCGILGLAKAVHRPPPVEAKERPADLKSVKRKKQKRQDAPSLFGQPSEQIMSEVQGG